MILIFSICVTAQNVSENELDSLYVKFLSIRAPQLLLQNEKPVLLTHEEMKCGFAICSELKFNLDRFSKERREILKSLFQRPVLDTSIVSASGFFRIHFDISGAIAPSYDNSLSAFENAQQVALAFDSAYSFEVNLLNFLPPPSDNGSGGDNKYDVYITSTGSNYGVTIPEDPLGNDKYTSYIEIHYSFQGFPTQGLAAARVTAAHEFHHSIQGGNYVWRIPDDTFFYEITSTSMEEFVFPDVNDYRFYLHSYFAAPEVSMSKQNGYNMAIWNLFLKERFGFDIIRQQWEMMPSFRAITAINNSILNNGSSFPKELNQFAIWTFFTNYRFKPGYFIDGRIYPEISPIETIQIAPPSETVMINSETVANNFVLFVNPSNNDSLYSIISNGDAARNLQNPNTTIEANYTLFTSATAGSRELNNNYSADFSVSENYNWSVSEILNNFIIREDTTIIPPSEQISFAYPNPFYYSKNGSISFPINKPLGEKVSLNIYTTGMFLVKDGDEYISFLPGGKTGVTWNGINNKNAKVASGVYIFVIKTGSEIKTGKIVIFNE